MTSEDLNDDAASDEKPDDTDDVKARKRKERLEQNRISARESRKRKKTMIEELQRTVITLSRENKDLNERNEQLRRQLMDIGSKYPNIVPLQAIVGQAAAQGPAADPTGAPAPGTTPGISSGAPPGGGASSWLSDKGATPDPTSNTAPPSSMNL